MTIKKAETLEQAKTRTEESTPEIEREPSPDRKYPKGVEVLSSHTAFEGPIFRVQTDQVREPNGKVSRRDVVRHPGSVVILAVDHRNGNDDPLVIVERQYRHAAAQYMFELPAGSLDPGEDPLEGAKRELTEETGYAAKRWSKLVRFFASPGFLGEWMQVYLAEDLVPGEADPEEDEAIQLSEVPLSELLRQIEKGEIHDGKTLTSLLLYARLRGQETRDSR